MIKLKIRMEESKLQFIWKQFLDFKIYINFKPLSKFNSFYNFHLRVIVEKLYNLVLNNKYFAH